MRTIQLTLFITALAILAGCGAQPLTLKNISAQKAREIINASSMVLLDVRTPAEYAESHIKGARLISVQDMPDSLILIDSLKSRPILVYCRSGHRSVVAGNVMGNNGFTNLTNMEGGINAWKTLGYPVESGPAK